MYASTSLKILRRYASSSTRAIIPSSVCPKEMEFFKEQSHLWWDITGPMKILITMVPVRIELLEKNLRKVGMIDADTMDPKKPFENLKILDVGCGGGLFAESMAKLGGTVTGVDANPALIRVAKEHMQQNPELNDNNLIYENVTVEEFALENKENFDVVVSSEVIEHVLDKDMFADNTLRCLRPGGSAFFTTMNRTLVSGFYYIYLCENVLNYIPKGAHEYEKFMRPKEMADLLRKYNCITTNVDGFTLNAFNATWFKVGFPHFNFALHAVKQKSFYK